MAYGKKWIGSSDVMIDEASGAILMKSSAPSSLSGGTKIVAVPATAESLVAASAPCRFVWVAARCDAYGNAQNTKPVFVGDSASQNIPIMPANFEGMVIQIDDANKLYVKVGISGEGIAYRIFT